MGKLIQRDLSYSASEQNMPASTELTTHIEGNGYLLLKNIFHEGRLKRVLGEVEKAIQLANQSSIKSRAGDTYAARNLGDQNPALLAVWRHPSLQGALKEVLGSQCGLVRILYFNKHPQRTWSLPWHKDKTIAVKDHSLPSKHFSKPTMKSGIQHVEASDSILQQMVTLRIHFDSATAENGALHVIAGSHRNSNKDEDSSEARLVETEPGDVLMMRPLLSHSSQSSKPGTQKHRRILHLEFAANPVLPDGFQWNRFTPVFSPR
ncbi:MAG: phytanoyl-CoA dioxygenase family protein [Planctomycetota bacterium]